MRDAIRVLVVDDEPLVRVGLGLIVDGEPDLELVGQAADGADAVEQAEAVRPDVVVMDVRMPGTDGVEATRQLVDRDHGTARTVAVLMLTTFNDDDAVDRAVRAGASGFLLKSAAAHTLAEAIRAVAAGDGWLDPAVTRRLLSELAARRPSSGPTPAQMATLTPREREVLALAALGLGNAEIAADLVVSEATIKTHIGRTLMKLGVHDRAQAVSAAFRSGLVEPGPPGRRST